MAPPIITSFRWGQIICQHHNQAVICKDAIITPDFVTEWDWSQDGTRHNPGITPHAAAMLLSSCNHVILTRGVQLVLQVKSDTLNLLKSHGKSFEVLQTEQAIARYNELARKGVRVGGLFHSTC